MQKTTAPSILSLKEIGLACAGLSLLGLCVGLGSGDMGMALRSAPTVVLTGLGALVLTGPALLIAHQFLGYRAPPDALIGALVRGFVACGRLALGLSPFVLFFSVTSRVWLGAGAAALVVVAGVGFVATGGWLREAEASSRQDDSFKRPIGGLVWGWSMLTALIAARLGWEMLAFVVG